MKFIQLWKVIKLVKSSLKIEDELTLSYLKGIKLNEYQKVINSETRYPGLLLQCARFLFFLIKSLSFSKKKISYSSDILLYAGTKNQYQSLLPTMQELKRKGIKYNIVAPKSICAEAVDYKLSLVDTLAVFYIFITLGFKLILRLKKAGKTFEIANLLSIYFCSYIHLTFFAVLLINLTVKGKLSLVIISNDHSNPNRSLRVLCEQLGLKTLYMQHASVSKIFPPLQYDYALLDGRAAYNTYLSCIDNLPNTKVYPVQVFLSGQKKAVTIQTTPTTELFDIGVAVNTLDDFVFLKDFLIKANTLHLSVLIRTHPRQEKEFLEKLNTVLESKVQWCDPQKEEIQTFFSSIKCLVAANTSIHLEAALAGLATLYYEFNSNSQLVDYYGYLESGLTCELNINNLSDSITKGIENSNTLKRNKAVQMYSATYMTQWENKEGILATELIEKIISGDSFENLFKLTSEPGDYKLHEVIKS